MIPVKPVLSNYVPKHVPKQMLKSVQGPNIQTNIQGPNPRFSKKEMIPQNSVTLNVCSIIIIGLLVYFMYNIYLERKLAVDIYGTF